MSTASKGKKRSKFESEFANVLDATTSSPDGDGHTFAKLLSLLCKNLTAFFAADSNSFIQADIFEKLAEPLVSKLITLNSLGTHFKPFIEDCVKPLIFEMLDRIDQPTLWVKFNSELLLKTRQSFAPEIRAASLEVVNHLFNKLGERYLVVLNDTIPFLSESLEDDSQEVEMLAKEIVKRI